MGRLANRLTDYWTNLVLFGILIMIAWLLYYILIERNPYQSKVADLVAEANRANEEIDGAESIGDCELLAGLYFARKAPGALPKPSLKPDYSNLMAEGGIPKLGAPHEQMKNDLKAQITIVADTSVYLLACLYHLDESGIVSIEKSLPEIFGKATVDSDEK